MGDAARDRRDWSEAARHYRAHLEREPEDAGILVQLGHMLKEGGDLLSAESAYRRAMAMRPEDHDIPLQLGHALKLQGRLDEAREAYGLSDALAPVNHAALELERMGERPARPARSAKPRPSPGPDLAALEAEFQTTPTRRRWHVLREAGRIAEAEGQPGPPHLLDVTDLLNMLRATGRATGIQRVQIGICAYLLAEEPERWRFVALEAPLGPIWTLAPDDLRALLRYATEEAHDTGRARALVEAALDGGRATHLDSARSFLTLGAFWFLVGATALLDGLRARGLRLGMMAYDLIPLTHPEHTDAGTVAGFRQALDEGAPRWEFALAISEYTAAGMRRALAERGAPDVPVRAVPLAHRFSDAVAEGWPAALADLRSRPFVLCVGTIESRKNHLALFQAWKILLEEGAEPPPLVCVGRPGWRVGDLLAQLEATGFLGGRIRMLHGISDPELASLYREAAFTVFPSFTEGWGLPVGESLALGTPCLASPEGATPEAGSGFAPPLDPYSPRTIAEAVRRWAESPEALARERARIAQGFQPRDWDDVGRDFRRAFEECLKAAAPRPPAAAPPLAEGADLGFPALAALLGPGFEPPSGDVAWVAGRAAALRISAPPGRLVLSFAARPWALDNRVALDDAPSLPLTDGMALSLDWRGGEGLVRLRLSGSLDAPPDAEDGRPVRMGLRRLALLPEGAPPLARGRAVVPGDAALWAALAPARDTIAFRPDALAGERIHLLLGVAGEEAPRRQSVLPGEDGVVRLSLDGARPVFLAWAAESDLPGRLALLEAHPAALPLAERIAALEGAEDAPLPPGEAGRWARRLAG